MGKEKGLHQLIFFVTSRCNSACQHCFNKNNLNQAKELSLGEIDEISKKLPQIDNLLLSGGEPFLRPDLPELIKIFYSNSKIKTVSIPSNGLLTQEIIKQTKKICLIAGLELVNLNISLDGLSATHDKIRGVPGNYALAAETIRQLAELKKTRKQLKILVNSVITKDNFKNLFDLAKLLKKDNLINMHYFEVLRSANLDQIIADNKWLNFSFYNKVLKLQYDYFKCGLKSSAKPRDSFRKIKFLGNQSFIYLTQYFNFKKHYHWCFACAAGKNILVMNHDGSFRLCELRGKSFSVEDINKGKQKFLDESLSIKKRRCSCTHVCFISSSISDNFIIRKFLFPILGVFYYIKYEYFNHNSHL